MSKETGRTALRAGVVLAAVVAALWLLAPRDPAASRESYARPAAERSVRAPGPAPAPIAEARPEGPAPAEPVPAPEHESTESPPVHPSWTIRGTVVVVDREGVEHAAESGTMLLWIVQGSFIFPHEIVVQDGRWSVDVNQVPDRYGLRIEVVDLKLGGRPAWTEAAGPELPADRFVAFRARWAGRSVLRVVDLETRLDLDDVEVLDRNPNTLDNQPKGNGWVLNARSPIELPEGSTAQRFWVHAPGHAWASIEVDVFRGGEWVLPLPRGAALTVTLRNCPEPSEVEVHVDSPDRPDRHDAVRRPTADGTVRFDDLQPGSCQVRAGLDRRMFLGLGEERIELAAGGRSAIVLDLADPPKETKVPLEGTLVFAPGQSHYLERLEIGPIDPDSTQPGVKASYERDDSDPPDVIRWRTEPVVPGRYRAVLPECLSVELDVGPAGERNARIQVPELGELELETVDRETGREVFVQHVSWISLSGNVTGHPWPRSASQRHRIRAPVGEIRLRLHDSIWHTEALTLQVPPGRGNATVQLDRTCWVRMVFMEGTTPISEYFDLKVASGPGVLLHGARRDLRDGFLYGLTRPGRYRLVIPEYDGVQPVPPIMVDATRHEVAERTIRVVRTR